MRFLHVLIFILCISVIYTHSQENYSIKKLPFNTDESGEIGGYFFDNQLIYSTNGSSGNIMNYSYNLFKINQNDDMTWDESELLDFDLTTNQHNAPIFLNKAKDKIYITSANVKIEYFNKQQEKDISSGIYMRNFKDGRWSYTATGFVHNKEGLCVAHACLNNEEDQLFYIANFDGGYGGTDIYVSYLIDGIWSEYQNLGAEINSTGNEMYPFMHKDGKLYFSSDAHNSVGRLDVFYSEKVKGKWTKPAPVGKPINSTSDDFAFFIDDKSERGFFSSNRDASNDIYSILSNFPEFNNCTETENISRCVTLFETRTSGLDTTIFDFEWELGDGNILFGEEVDHCYEKNGNYNVKLHVYDKLTGKKNENVADAIVHIGTSEGVFFDTPSECKVNEVITCKNIAININGFDNSKLYWDFGDGSKIVGDNASYKYKHEGEYFVKLGLISDKGVIKELEKYCVYRKIKVIK